jgi:hypothetical protein
VLASALSAGQQQAAPAAALEVHALVLLELLRYAYYARQLTRFVSLRRLHSLLASMSRAFIFHF